MGLGERAHVTAEVTAEKELAMDSGQRHCAPRSESGGRMTMAAAAEEGGRSGAPNRTVSNKQSGSHKQRKRRGAELTDQLQSPSPSAESDTRSTDFPRFHVRIRII